MIEVERIDSYTSHSVSLNLLNLFFYLSFLLGTIIYFFSKYKQTKLLTFNFSLILISEIRALVFLLFGFEDWTNKYTIYRISGIIISIVYILLSCYVINKHLNNTNEEITDDQSYLQNSSKYKRFCNYIIDGGLIIIIAFGIINLAKNNSIYMSFFDSLKSTFGDKLSLLFFISLVKVIYYLVYESIFKSTPAKFLTGCYVTDEEGNPPAFSMILKRTLFRLIPFESLSFLMDRNLHDNYSDTYVVDKKIDRSVEDRYLKFLVVGFGITLVFYFYMTAKGML